jgi:histidinol-phosphatase (PHP family)
VLTDYHLHLRPDTTDAIASEYFTQANADRFLDAAEAAGIAELGVSEHVHRFTEALEVWDHPFWRENAVDDLGEYLEFSRGAGLKAGIEMDWVAGREDRIANLLDRHRDRLDYVVGSVHFLRDKAVDHEGYDVWGEINDPDRVWALYFETFAEAIGTGMYDICAHPDLVKVWGKGRPGPRRDPRFYYEPLVEAIADTGVAVEVSTAGLRKPVGELYPSDAFAGMCVDAGAAFALSSDAHEPENVGYGYEQAVEAMRGWGVTQLCVFEGRERRLEDIG